jgi:hypothetical protein
MMRRFFVPDLGYYPLLIRLRRRCSAVVPMPADGLLFWSVRLTWVRLEARPLHIPPRIA